MAVSTEVTNVSYPGNGSTTIEYPVPFPVTDGSHIKVGVKPLAGPFAQLPAWDYTVVVKPGGTFAVTTTAAAAATSVVVIWREVPATQPVELPLAGRLPSTSIEAGLDRATMQIQELKSTLSRAIKMDWSASPQSDVIPTPNALFGFDAEGNFEPVEPARIRELAQLEGDGANAMVTWADEAARASTVPTFTGQLGVQRDDRTVWTSLSTTGGDWVPTAPGKTVRNEAQLLNALASGGHIGIHGAINTTGPLLIDQDGTRLFAATPDAAIVYNHVPGETHTVIEVAAKNVWIDGIEITTNHPLTSSIPVYDAAGPGGDYWTFTNARYDTAVVLAADDTTDISGFRLTNCYVHHVMRCVQRGGVSTTTRYADNILIAGNRFESFGDFCMNLIAKFRGIIISKNKIFGRAVGETHQQIGNGIWLGNFADQVLIEGNEIARCGRHGIEYWNSQLNPTNTNGNLNAIITGNLIHDMVNGPHPAGGDGDGSAGSFGISAFGNGIIRITGNTVRDCTMGIETYGDQTNLGFLHCVGNSIERWGQYGSLSVGISINGIRGGALIANNRIGEPFDIVANNTQSGILVINGGSNVQIEGNQMYNAGMNGVLVLGKFIQISAITQAADGVFTASVAFDTSINNGWAVGKRVYLQNIAGMTSLNGRYYTITALVDESGGTATQFKLGVDTSALPAYSGSGRMLERYDGLVITNNVIRRNKIPGISGYRAPMWIISIQEAVIKDNISYTKASLQYAPLSTFSLSNFGTVRTGNNGDASVVVSNGTGLEGILGSNLEIAIPE